jgi:C-terminal processing protease CtpA/Prc
MALMNRQPEVIRAGDNTQGVFSDKLRRRLPNGWVFALPNEVYLTKEGASFDVDGVPPHIHVSLFTQKDLEQSSDSGIEKGLEVMFSDRSARAVVPKVAR